MQDIVIKTDTLKSFADKLRACLCNDLSYSASDISNDFLQALTTCADSDKFRLITKNFNDSFSVPNGVNSIGDYTFYQCNNLSSIYLPDGIKYIGAYAFYACTNLSSINLPDSLINIGGYAFSGCKKLTSIIIPASVSSINTYAFMHCSNLIEVTFKGKPTSIAGTGAGAAFEYCDKIVTINVPWSEGEVAGAPWGATNATINYNYVSAGE